MARKPMSEETKRKISASLRARNAGGGGNGGGKIGGAAPKKPQQLKDAPSGKPPAPAYTPAGGSGDNDYLRRPQVQQGILNDRSAAAKELKAQEHNLDMARARGNPEAVRLTQRNLLAAHKRLADADRAVEAMIAANR